MTDSFDVARPPPSRRERAALLRFWTTLQERSAEIDEAVERAAEQIPAFAAIMAAMTPELREQQRAHSKALQRAAIVDDDWTAYLDDLRAQGRTYAAMGIPFAEWFTLLASFRRPIKSAVIDPNDRDTWDVLDGMHLFLDRSIATLGQAYVDAMTTRVSEAESRLRQYIDLVHSAPLGMEIWQADAPGDSASFRLVAFNPAAARMVSDPDREVIGARLPDRGDAERADEAAALMAECMRAGEPRRWVARGPGDPPRVYQGLAFPLGDAYVGTINEDITERETMRRSIERHMQDLERSNRELDEFAYVASHDLKSPLQDIRNLAGWIEQDAADALPDGSRRHLGLLVDRVRRMERLLDDLLEYSRVGREHAVWAVVRVSDIIADVIAFVGPPAGFTIETTGTVPPVRIRRVPLEKILRNLVSNAIKHHDRNEGRIVIDAQHDGDSLALTVSDDGPGIPPEFHERVFRMFQTLKPRDAVEGSGVGLAIVKKTVEHHGGAVALQSDGRGTTVRVTWPIAEDDR